MEEIARASNTTARKLASEFGMTRQGIDKRLRGLERDGCINSVTIGNSVVWNHVGENPGSSQVETGDLEATVRDGSDFVVDITADVEEDPSLLVQAGPDGYQMDAWWGDRQQASTWVNFDQADNDYPHDNRHSRDPSLLGDGGTVIIHDPEPRVPEMGFSGADIGITHGEMDGTPGFHATLTWTDDQDVEREQTSFVPLVDPRMDKERFMQLAYE